MAKLRIDVTLVAEFDAGEPLPKQPGISEISDALAEALSACSKFENVSSVSVELLDVTRVKD